MSDDILSSLPPAPPPEAEPGGKLKRMTEHALTVLIVFFLAANVWWFFLRDTSHPMEGGQAAAFSLPTVLPDGTRGPPLALEAQRGKVVLLDFWATWCEPCKRQMPALDKLHRSLPAERFTLVSVNIDQAPEPQRLRQVSALMGQGGYGFPVVLDTGATQRAYRVERIPTLILLDATGQIAQVHTGLLDEAALRPEIDALLKDMDP